LWIKKVKILNIYFKKIEHILRNSGNETGCFRDKCGDFRIFSDILIGGIVVRKW
jgi:hypothetical protein